MRSTFVLTATKRQFYIPNQWYAIFIQMQGFGKKSIRNSGFLKAMEIIYTHNKTVLNIRYIEISGFSIILWDKCIPKFPNETIYAFSGWLDRVADRWDALVMDEIFCRMPLVHKKKYGLKYIYQPFFTQQCGVFSTHGVDADLLQKFISSIPRKFIRVSMNLNRSCTFKLKGVSIRPN